MRSGFNHMNMCVVYGEGRKRRKGKSGPGEESMEKVLINECCVEKGLLSADCSVAPAAPLLLP